MIKTVSVDDKIFNFSRLVTAKLENKRKSLISFKAEAGLNVIPLGSFMAYCNHDVSQKNVLVKSFENVESNNDIAFFSLLVGAYRFLESAPILKPHAEFIDKNNLILFRSLIQTNKTLDESTINLVDNNKEMRGYLSLRKTALVSINHQPKNIFELNFQIKNQLFVVVSPKEEIFYPTDGVKSIKNSIECNFTHYH